MLGLETLTHYIRNLLTLSAEPESIIVVNDVPWVPPYPTLVAELRAHATFGPQTLANMVVNSSLLMANPLYPGFAVDRPVAYRFRVARMLQMVADELAARLEMI